MPTECESEVHVHDFPWSEDGFLVRILECREYLRYRLYTFSWEETITIKSLGTDAMSYTLKHLFIIVLGESSELILRESSRHEFLP